MSEHTPGPWNVCEPVGWMPQGRHWTAEQMMEMWWVGKRPGVAVALIDGSADGRAEAEANARLIAAAPDLLAALQSLVEQLPQPNLDDPDLDNAIDEANALIAKTRGE